MPKRTTPFQTLVHHIQEQLSSGAVVTESKMLENRRTGFKREVDVVIEATVGEHALVAGLECVEHGRAADVSWVETMIGKHQNLPTDRLVLVSSSGFSVQAKILAESEGVAVMTEAHQLQVLLSAGDFEATRAAEPWRRVNATG